MTEQWAFGNLVLNFVVPRVEGIMGLGQNQARYIDRRWKTAPSVAVIGHQVDTEFYSPVLAPAARENPLVLAVGEDAGRDFATLLKALDQVDVESIVKTRQALLIAHKPRVRHVSGWLTHLELRTLYSQSSIVVVPLSGETTNASGVSTILEASAMGKALVVTDFEGIKDFIVPGNTCLTVPPKNVGALCESIKVLCRDANLRRRLGENARRFVETNFSIPVFAGRLAAALALIRESADA
jgi:glycosyltransferase involved in cell wall biosynthesis